MIFAVERYMDAFKVKYERETVPGFAKREDKYHYFETEAQAREFLCHRAKINLENAEAKARAAKKRLQKCRRKFGMLDKGGSAE